MLRRVQRLAFLSTLCFQATSAMALVDAQVMVGRRWYDIKLDGEKSFGVASQEVQAAVHVDPIPLVPVAFGVAVTSGMPNKGDFTPKASTVSLFSVSADVQAWLPMVPFVTPYVRLRYPVQSNMVIKYDNDPDVDGKVSRIYKTSGPQISLGAKLPVLPLTKLLFEASQGMEKLSSEEIEAGGVKAKLKSDGDAPSKSLIVGVEVGL